MLSVDGAEEKSMTSPAREKRDKQASDTDLFPENRLTEKTGSMKRIRDTRTSELVIALCGPIGSPMVEVADVIEKVLKGDFNYEICEKIRLSDFISQYAEKVGMSIKPEPGFDRINNQIDAGNKLRDKYGSSVLAELAVVKIRIDREKDKEHGGDKRHKPRRICHIINSIKNQEELDLLRSVYRDMLYVFGVFSPLEKRRANLKQKELKDIHIYELIDRDSGEELKNGQTVSDTFPKSDFFLRVDSGTNTEDEVKRFLNLIFGTKVITPTLEESAMYMAASAAASSACLSRQVGAAVTTAKGEILATGWNDVPQFGGGLYVHGPKVTDERCWNHSSGAKCFNQEKKISFAEDLLKVLKEFIPAKKHNDAKNAILSSSKLKGLIEFSRSIHAEMHAILNAGKLSGDKMIGGKLFVTTYPCHSCARHIVAAGIKAVYFIEPYRKSLATELHSDAITESETDHGKVRLLPFSGVAPSRYLDLFRVPSNSRKNEDGLVVSVEPKDACPRLGKSMEAFHTLEGMVVDSLAERSVIPPRVEQKLRDAEGGEDGKGKIPPTA